MARSVRIADKVLNRYGSRITDLVGGNLSGTSFQFYRGGDYRNASGFASPGQVNINRKYWRDMSRQERMGFLVHELTHVARGAKSGDREERLADAARYALVGNVGGWKASAEARRTAERKGWDSMETGAPRDGRGGGRRRNTWKNDASKVAPPALPGSSVVGYQAQRTGAYSNYTSIMAQIRQNIALAKANRMAAFADARRARISETAAAEGNAIERGVLGSSTDYANRAAAVANEAAAKVAARGEAAQAIGASRVEGIRAGNDLYSTLAQIQAARAAEMADIQNQAFYNNLFDRIRSQMRKRRGRSVNISPEVEAWRQQNPGRTIPAGPQPGRS